MTRPHLVPAPLADRTVFAFWRDALLLILFPLIQSPRITGQFAHEAIGLAIAVPLVLHSLRSCHWTTAKERRLGAGASWPG